MNYSAVLLKYALCYLMMFLFTWIGKINNSNKLFDAKGLLAVNRAYLIALHLAGILWFGFVPLTYLHKFLNEILLSNRLPHFFWLILFGLLMIAMAFTGSRAARQIHIKKNDPGLSNKFLICYILARILFLCAYELFFRGFLLFDSIKWFGTIPAVLFTTALTVLIHLFSNKKEMWACIPFGILLSVCCIAFNAVWPAIALHLTLSFTYEIPVVKQFFYNIKSVK